MNSTWTRWDVAYLAVLCMLLFADYMPVWFDKHFNSNAVSTSGCLSWKFDDTKKTNWNNMMSALTSNLTVQDQHRRYNALKNYFTARFSYEEICNVLFCFHRIRITVRHLNCLLRQCNLQRRGNHSGLNILSAKLTKWSNTLKQFVGNLPTN